MAREVEEESGDLEPSSLSVELREGGCLHIVSLCVSSPEARSKLLLTREDGWRPFYGMGGYGSKDNVVADSIDNSTNLSKEYAMLRLHGGTSALFAGAAASAVLIYIFYKLFCWKRARMNRARQRAPKDEGRFVWDDQGRLDMEEGGVPDRVARRLPVVFRAPAPATVFRAGPQPPAFQPRIVHEEVCEECREEAARDAREEAGYDVLRGHFRPLPPLV